VKTAIAENSNSNVNQHAQNHHFQKYKTVLVADAGAVFFVGRKAPPPASASLRLPPPKGAKDWKAVDFDF